MRHPAYQVDMEILLLDLDDVLLETHAYHDSLIEALDRISAALGFGSLHLTDNEIRSFEAAGVTAEWDSSAITVALLLDAARRHAQHVTLPYALPPELPAPAQFPRPDLLAFIQRLASEPGTGADPCLTAESLLLAHPDGRTPATLEALRQVLRNGYDVRRSVSHRLIQELNLGSRLFSELYGTTAWMECEGYMQTHDLPALSAPSRDHLRAWISAPGHAASVFTNRACHRPDRQPAAPEMELGLKAAGLPDLPAIGMGPLAWLAEQHHLLPYAYLKPSPVHTLAAMRRALGDTVEIAVERAAALSQGGQADEGWLRLEGATLIAFDDAAKGIRSAAAAQQVLEQRGIRVEMRKIGVSPHPAKARALHEAGARLYPDATSALEAEVFRPGTAAQ
jgi:hypothetical protein